MKRLISLGLLASGILLWFGCGSDHTVTPTPQAAAQFAFIRHSGNVELASVRASRLSRMTPRERLATRKSIAKKMRAIAAADSSTEFSLYTMKVDGTAETLVPSSAAPYYYSVALSPDGKTIVFDTDSSTTNYQNVNLYMMNSDGTNLTALTTDAEGDSTEPRFTADGKSIFYVNYPAAGGASQVWTYDLNTLEKEQITNVANLSFWAPNSSADGMMGVAMAYDSSTGDTNVYMVNVDSQAVTQVTTGDNWNYYWPTFTPDGKKIVVTAWDYDTDNDKDDLLVMNLDGTGLAALTDVDNGIYADDANIVGQKLVYQVWGSNQTFDLYSMNADGSSITQLTNNSLDDTVDYNWLWSGY